MSQEFNRENRYLVIKREDIAKYLSEPQQQRLNSYADEIVMRRIEDGKTDHGYVVVSDDWPEYEPTFNMIEARVTGKPNEIQSLTAQLEAAEKEIDRMTDQMNLDTQLLAEQAAQIEALKKDAWRYQVIRDGEHGNEAGFVGVDGQAIYGEKLDEYCEIFSGEDK